VLFISKTRHLDKVIHPCFPVAYAVKFRYKPEVLLYIHIGIKRIVLGKITNPSSYAERIFHYVNAIDKHCSGIGRYNTCQYAHHGGFACTVRPQKTQDLSVLYIKRDIIERGLVSELLNHISNLYRHSQLLLYERLNYKICHKHIFISEIHIFLTLIILEVQTAKNMTDTEKFLAPPGGNIRLDDYQTDYTGNYGSKREGKKMLETYVKESARLQDILYAEDRQSILIIFQAMDAAGKDGTIKHVMAGINPQGCQVFSFKAPSAEELEHDFLWRTSRRTPERGRIGIFNRSYYEEVIITRVHPEFIVKQKLPGIYSKDDITEEFWNKRFTHINNFEKQQSDSGTIILKFFLHLSKEEQKSRFLSRINKPEKNWKFTLSDIEEREKWDSYQQAYEKAINNTSTGHAPWYIIPADKKWFMRTAVCEILVKTMEKMDLKYPSPGPESAEILRKAKEILTSGEK
jgi:PPK2 family polyphosphate:nucleotide phosphotransferase